MSSSLILHTTRNHFSIRLWCAMKSGFYKTTGNDQLSGWTKKKLQSTSQSQTCTKKRSRSLVVYYPSDPLQLSESWRNHYIWEVCSAHWKDTPKTAMLAATIGQQKDLCSFSWQRLTACRTTNASKVEWIGQWSFASSAIFIWLLVNWLSLLQASQQRFAGKMLPQPTGGRKCFLRICGILKHELFMLWK